MSSLSSLLFPGYRRRILGLLLLHPESSYHVREIARLTHTLAGSLHRELSRLAETGVLTREKSGNQVYYQANVTCPIFRDLVNILQKTSGLADVLADALTPWAEKINVAFVFGSIANETETYASDVDVLIVGKISFIDAVSALNPAQEIISREINPKIYSMAEWRKLVNNKDAFVQDILKKKKLFILGDENDLKQSSRKNN
jgi:predicted nucleotidyltransferase